MQKKLDKTNKNGFVETTNRKRQKIRPRERVYPYDSIVHNGGLEQYWVKSFGTIVCTISGNVPTNFELQRLKGTLLLKLGEMAAYKR